MYKRNYALMFLLNCPLLEFITCPGANLLVFLLWKFRIRICYFQRILNSTIIRQKKIGGGGSSRSPFFKPSKKTRDWPIFCKKISPGWKIKACSTCSSYHMFPSGLCKKTDLPLSWIYYFVWFYSKFLPLKRLRNNFHYNQSSRIFAFGKHFLWEKLNSLCAKTKAKTQIKRLWIAGLQICRRTNFWQWF